MVTYNEVIEVSQYKTSSPRKGIQQSKTSWIARTFIFCMTLVFR